MLKSVFILLYIGTFILSVLGECGDKKKDPPVWCRTYTAKGILTIPYTETEEPFEAWYDAASDQSRIDYYNGTTKTYQLPSVSENGVSLKIVPVTTEKKSNVKTCLLTSGTDDSMIEIQSVLPDLSVFSCVADESVDEHEVEVWELEERKGVVFANYRMYLYYIKDPNDTNKEIPVPLRFEMKGSNYLFEGTSDHTYLQYETYSTAPIPEEIFKLPENFTCHAMSGDTAAQRYTFNPMAEHIYPVKKDHVDFEFDKFRTKHKKDYQNQTEYAKRLSIFQQNLRYIHSMNRKNLGFSLAVNHLADKTQDELKVLRGRRYHAGYNGGAPFPYSGITEDDFPNHWDWRLYGAVTQVKDQASCGSCWSFGTTGAIESAYFLKTGYLFRLSQQALIDCSWGFENMGCDGGYDFQAYQWVMKHGGVPTEESYGPYLSQDGLCHADDADVTKIANISGYVNVTTNDENALRLAIFKNGPVSVAINAGLSTMSFYSHGVYYDPDCTGEEEDLNHAVLAVGYGVMNDQRYWLIKNSWSHFWGNNGYILMSSKDNNCGVMTMPTYVTI